MIFAVFDVLLAVNMCINYSFLHLYLQFYYGRTYLKFKKAGHVLALDGVYLTKKKKWLASLVQKLHAPLGVIHVPLRSTRRGLSIKEKTKCLALPVQKL